MSEKQMKTLGWIATFMSVMMYILYIPQIMGSKRELYPTSSSCN